MQRLTGVRVSKGLKRKVLKPRALRVEVVLDWKACTRSQSRIRATGRKGFGLSGLGCESLEFRQQQQSRRQQHHQCGMLDPPKHCRSQFPATPSSSPALFSSSSSSTAFVRRYGREHTSPHSSQAFNSSAAQRRTEPPSVLHTPQTSMIKT